MMRYAWIVLSCFALMPAYGQKQKDIEYQLRRNATIEAMDSLFRYTQTLPGDKRPDDELLMKFADEKCKEFHNDTLLTSRLAEYFATRVGRVDLARQRFRELKRIHPQYLSGYYTYANVLHSHGTTVTPEGSLQRQPEYRDLAKAQIDSAKAVAPTSIQPYQAWLEICAPFAFSEAVRSDMDEEVDALNKAFPQANAYYVAAEVLRKTTPATQNMEDAKDRSDSEYKIDRKALDYYERINVETMTAFDLEALSSYYYTSTRSPYMDREDKLQLYDRGAELSRIGAEKFPDSIGFQRMLLWHYAEVAKNDTVQRVLCSQEAHQAAERLFNSSDANLVAVDYFYDGVALQYLNRYSEATIRYKKALEKVLPTNDAAYKRDSLTAYQDLADCYMQMNDYESAIAAMNAVNGIRKRRSQYGFSEAYNLARVYETIAADTFLTANERMQAYISADSLYQEIQTSIDNGVYELAEGNTGYGSYLSMIARRNMDRLQPDRTEYVTFPMAMDVVSRLEPVPIEELSSRESRYLGSAYNILRLYYYGLKDYKETLRYAEAQVKLTPGSVPENVMAIHRKDAKRR